MQKLGGGGEKALVVGACSYQVGNSQQRGGEGRRRKGGQGGLYRGNDRR